MDAKIMCVVGASHHKRSVLAASTCVKITCCFTKQPEANTIVGGGRGREGVPGNTVTYRLSGSDCHYLVFTEH